ncbi:hypothetical protein [Fimbriiglobus ruber]|uniref:Uncharacterized protein n=1 Tax=Fimbriiglobus ruber TaxID=1908690 RepID=A0A225DZN2_9BACT|nr:hypothetical protein [Fimbriiglobus ruber]OWK43998.1 hypothetical protein FRUB_03597 [Fimbriiglobus ruber]
MVKTAKSGAPTITRHLTPDRTGPDQLPPLRGLMRADYANPRTVHTLAGITRLHLTVRRCHQYGCVARRRPYRPEAEGALVLPRHEFGLDVIALIGALRSTEHRASCSPSSCWGRGFSGGFAVECEVEPRRHESLANVLDRLGATAERVSDLGIGPGRTIRNRLSERSARGRPSARSLNIPHS